MINIKKSNKNSQSTFVNMKRYNFILISISIVFCIYIIRLIDWQIINGQYYYNRANSSNTYSLKTDSIRGEILDANGIGLAVNNTVYRVVLDRLQIDTAQENKIILNVVNILNKLNNEWIDVLPIKIDNDVEFVENRDTQINSLKKFLNLPADSTATECFSKLIEKYNCTEFNKAEQRIICSVKYNIDKIGGYNAKVSPYIIAENVSQQVMTIFSEYSDILKGIKIEPYTMRVYPNGTLAPHIIGYIGSMSNDEYEKYKNSYSLDDFIGKSGIEKAMEQYLRGQSGKKVIQVSKTGNIMSTETTNQNIPGNNVYLTISSELQNVVNKSLEKNIKLAQQKGVKDCQSGAAVVLNVKDFSILAAGTYPTYDLSRFINEPDYYSELISESENNPLLNRAFNGAYPPGSVYKPLVACAGLQENVITPDEDIRCNGKFTFYKGYKLKCMGVHRNINMINAIAKSCNVFFAELGRRLGIELLEKYAKKFGMGIQTGIELYENKGIVAGPEHSKNAGGTWYESGSSQSAIGQSDNMVTPLQLAVYVGTIANNGKRLKPHLVKKITDFKKENIILENSSAVVEDMGISEENLNIVKEGMRQVVLSGTARSFQNYPISVSAKTGTAENRGSDHTTFICFAPSEAPEIAISVVVANGKYGTISTNIARDILNSYFQITE